MPLDDPSAAKPVTHEKDRPIGGYFWAYTNKHILYSQDNKGDENFHVYAVNLDTGEASERGKEAVADVHVLRGEPDEDRLAGEARGSLGMID